MQVNGEWKPSCLKYQLGQCNYPDCKYLHQCAFPRPDGTACGAKHSASGHSSVPHSQLQGADFSFTEAEQYESINMEFQDEIYHPSSAAIPLPINPHSQHDNQEMQQSEHDVSPMVNSEYHQPDSNDVFPKIRNEDLGVSDIPHSIPNPSDSLMQTISEEAGPGIFLDICAGANRPLS